MKVRLYHRHLGIHTRQRETEVPGEFSDYATLKDGSGDEYTIEEDELIAALPAGFLPAYPRRRVLLTVADENGSTGQTGLHVFRDWAKYFDAFALTLVKAEAPDPAIEDARPDPAELGAEACRAAMREVPREPVRTEIYSPADPLNRITETAPGARRTARCVILLPTLDFVSVRAVLCDWGGGLTDLAVLSPGEKFENYIFVRYPSDPSLITGPEYGRELRAAIVKALDALKTDAPAPAS
jgi:hypothetical protein